MIKHIYNKTVRIKDYLMDNLLYYAINDSNGMSLLKQLILSVLKGQKQLVGFYGECHIYIYGGLLSRNTVVKKKYVLLGAKEIEYMAKWHCTQIQKKESWNKLDVLIYNSGVPVRKGAPSLEKVLGWVSDTCKKIEVTNAAFKGYMPQHTERVFKNNGFFIWGDKNLNKIIEEELFDSLDELEKDDFYDTEYVNTYFSKSVKRMKLYEKSCTVGIADYIELHGRDRVLYYSVTHPENEIMIEITRRILMEMGICEWGANSKIENKNGLFDLHSHGEIVYPSVYKGLGIKENPKERRIQPGNYKKQVYSFKEYLRQYVDQGKELIGEST